LGIAAATRTKITNLLRDGKPWASKDIARELEMSRSRVESCLGRMWRSNKILRSTKPIICSEKTFRGRKGIITNQRQYYTYLLPCSEGNTASVFFEEQQYVVYSEKYLDKRGGSSGNLESKSKAKVIKEFLEEHRDQAFFSNDLTDALKDQGIKPSDIMTTVRRLEKKGVVYVRGYRLHDRQTPFKDGYLLTWINNNNETIQEKTL
jgi:Mn-dependent DtxR family transcriptional regulator